MIYKLLYQSCFKPQWIIKPTFKSQLYNVGPALRRYRGKINWTVDNIKWYNSKKICFGVGLPHISLYYLFIVSILAYSLSRIHVYEITRLWLHINFSISDKYGKRGNYLVCKIIWLIFVFKHDYTDIIFSGNIESEMLVYFHLKTVSFLHC